MHHFSVSESILFLTFRAFKLIETTGGKQKQSEKTKYSMDALVGCDVGLVDWGVSS